MIQACNVWECEENAHWKFMGEFEVEEDVYNPLYLCNDHYQEFVDTLPIELIELMISIDIKQIFPNEKQ